MMFPPVHLRLPTVWTQFLQNVFFLQLFANTVTMSLQRSLAYPHHWPIQTYLVLHQNVPLLALGLLLIGYTVPSQVIKAVNGAVVLGAVMTLLVQGVTQAAWTAPIFRLYWQYHAWYLYVAIFLGMQYLLRRNRFSGTHAFLISLLATKLVGVLYELPIYWRFNPYVGIWAHHLLPFYINGVWFILPLLLYWMWRHTRVLMRPALVAVAVWLAGCVVYSLNPHGLTAYLPRLPAAAMMVTVMGVMRPVREQVLSIATQRVVSTQRSV